MNILKSITFYTIDNYIASFEESIDHLYRDLPVLDPEVQDGIDRILDPMVSEAEALHTFEMGNRLTLEPARLVALQNFATHSTLKETAAAVNLLPGLLAVYDATVTGQAPEDALRLLSGLQNQLSQTLIPGKLKKRFLSYLQKLKNNNNDQLRQKEVQAWRLEAEGFKPATEEQLEAFLDTAPNKELKRQYEKKLRQLMETGRKEKEKLREQEDKERREQHGHLGLPHTDPCRYAIPQSVLSGSREASRVFQSSGEVGAGSGRAPSAFLILAQASFASRARRSRLSLSSCSRSFSFSLRPVWCGGENGGRGTRLVHGYRDRPSGQTGRLARHPLLLLLWR